MDSNSLIFPFKNSNLNRSIKFQEISYNVKLVLLSIALMLDVKSAKGGNSRAGSSSPHAAKFAKSIFLTSFVSSNRTTPAVLVTDKRTPVRPFSSP